MSYYLMSSLKDTIYRLCHAFLFKWKHNFDAQMGLHVSPSSNNWSAFMTTNHNIISNICEKLLFPTYTKQVAVKTMINRINFPILDLTLCETMCYPHDTVILLTGIREKDLKVGDTGRAMNIAVTAFGSIICKTNTDVQMVKYGTIRYADEIIRLIKLFQCSNSLNIWIEMLGELDVLQNHLMLYNEIYSR